MHPGAAVILSAWCPVLDAIHHYVRHRAARRVDHVQVRPQGECDERAVDRPARHPPLYGHGTVHQRPARLLRRLHLQRTHGHPHHRLPLHSRMSVFNLELSASIIHDYFITNLIFLIVVVDRHLFSLFGFCGAFVFLNIRYASQVLPNALGVVAGQHAGSGVCHGGARPLYGRRDHRLLRHHQTLLDVPHDGQQRRSQGSNHINPIQHQQ